MSIIVFGQTIILILYMLVGALLSKKKLFTVQVEACLGWFLANIALPFAILMSFQVEYSSEIMNIVKKSLVTSIVIVALTMGLGFLFTVLFRRKGAGRRLWVACFTFSNILFIGIPIVSELLGPKGLIVLVTYNTVANLILFTVGVMIFSGSKEIDVIRIVKTPAIIAAALGFLLFVLHLSIPQMLAPFFTSIGNMTAPLSMIVNGAIFARSKIMPIILDKDNLLFSVLRLIALPACLTPLLKLTLHDPVILVIMCLVIGMPSGALNSVFAEQYVGEGAKASQYIVLSTIISMFTLPLILLPL